MQNEAAGCLEEGVEEGAEAQAESRSAGAAGTLGAGPGRAVLTACSLP